MEDDPEPRGSVPAAGSPLPTAAAKQAFPITIWDILFIAVCGSFIIALGVLVLSWLAPSGRVGGPGSPSFDPTYAVLALEAVAIISSVFLFAGLRRRLGWADIGLRPVTRRQVRRAVIVGLLCFVVVTPVLAGFNALMNEPIISPQTPLVVGHSRPRRGTVRIPI